MNDAPPARDPMPPPPSRPGPQPRLRRFRLLRYFAIASLLGLALVTVGLIGLYNSLSHAQMVEHESQANADLTNLFANAVWAQHRHLVLESTGRDAHTLRSHPGLAALDADVRAKMGGSRVAKVKVYNRAGITVYSTDVRQIGEDKTGNEGFAAALAGRVASQVTFRESFDAFEGVLSNRSLVASYVPVRTARDAAPEGVFEVYSDVTPLVAQQKRALLQIVAAVLGTLAALYVFLHLVVRRADRLIAAQAREREVREAEARHLANHDALTGLPNRAYFAERLAEALAQSKRLGRGGALMFVDLDRFKIVNDSLGHDAGDALLKAVADRIRTVLRAGELLFRMGGDEFTVILPEVGEPAEAAHVAQRLVHRLAEPFPVMGHELSIGASVGIATFPGDGHDAETLLKNADAAMYTAKQAGRSTHAFYRREMNQRALHQLTLEAALQRAFREGEFVLHYQPVVDSTTRRVVAAEALLRWQRPGSGLVPPGEFIGVLEGIGLMSLVGEWVLRTACAELVRWRQAGGGPGRVLVNVSPVQFRAPGFPALVERALRDTGAPAARVELELTESMLIHDMPAAAATIGALRALGVRVAIDDFGTGYSSLAYLRHFAVDSLKIDRSFVAEVGRSERDRAVVRAICGLAQALKIGVVAEGVETEAQAQFFGGLPCAEMQGFLFSRPLPPAALDRHLEPAAASIAAAS